MKNKIYFVNSFRPTLLGSVMILVGLMFLSFIATDNFANDFSTILTKAIAGISAIALLFFGVKMLAKRNKIVQLELQDTCIKYRDIDMKSRGSGSDFFMTTGFKSINYADIEKVEIVYGWVDYVQVIVKNKNCIRIPYLNESRDELREIAAKINENLTQ